ncbi:MAG: helix-turn-helix domain-containing protein [Epsilonproteobacteria bacterium]|nr:helix-turn-helix domain-containing protein [Campylobacterota bacterium]
MIRFRLKELLADKAFREKRRITLSEVSEVTGIHRTTLSKIANQVDYNTTTENLEKLCEYFDCSVCDVAEYVRHES